MSEQPDAIERLPEETRSKLRSTQILTSLPQIVSELLQNSLDADATHIEVGIDLKEWMCWVKDDGHGISKEGLEKLGQGEGGRYNTSKAYAPGFMNSASTFGFRGEALASAAGISCLEICSRTDKSRNTWSVIVKGNQQLYLGSAVRWTRASHGTTVCVRDAFYNLPIRRGSHLSSSRTWDLVRQEIETYALMFPHVSFTLEDPSRPTERLHPKERIIRIPKTASTLDSFRHIFGRAMTNHIEEVDFSSDSIKITGFVSLTGATSKAYQYLYINRHPVSIQDFGRAIDLEFASSSFSNNALDDVEKDLPRSTIRRSPRKNEKKPVYVLNISIQPEEVDNCFEPSKNSAELGNRTTVISCLRTVVRSFLEKHNFRSISRDSLRSNNSSPVPSKRRKSGYGTINDSGYVEVPTAGNSGLGLEEDLEEKSIFKPIELYTSTDDSSEMIHWQDATTGERFVVDSRTGHSYPYTGYWAPYSGTVDSGLNCGEGRRTLRKSLATTMAATANSDSNISAFPRWLEQALQVNQAYATPESRIQSVKLPLGPNRSAPDCDQWQHKYNGYQRLHNGDVPQICQRSAFNSGYNLFNCGFTREDLRQAVIINQVDRKFIACRIQERSYDSSNARYSERLPEVTVILIDQHAADERIRVERFLKELCMGFLQPQNGTKNDRGQWVRVQELTPPRPVLLTHRDASTVMQSRDAREFLRRWGVQIAFPPNSLPDLDRSLQAESSPYSQVLVSTVPEIVSEKLLQGDELRDLIQGFLGQIENGELIPDSQLDFYSESEQGEFAWLKALRYCPRGILELVNSKACRGAIMFNDSLSIEECGKLVQKLSKTAFPFQCAHGRPTLVPVVDTRILHKGSVPCRIPQHDWTRLAIEPVMDEG